MRGIIKISKVNNFSQSMVQQQLLLLRLLLLVTVLLCSAVQQQSQPPSGTVFAGKNVWGAMIQTDPKMAYLLGRDFHR